MAMMSARFSGTCRYTNTSRPSRKAFQPSQVNGSKLRWALIIAINKWDVAESPSGLFNGIRAALDEGLAQLKGVPVMAALMQRDPQQFEKFTRDYRPLLLGLARKLSGRSAVEPEDAGYVIQTNRGVLRSLDGGVTWEPVNVGLARKHRFEVALLEPDPWEPGRLFALPWSGGGLFTARFPIP